VKHFLLFKIIPILIIGIIFGYLLVNKSSYALLSYQGHAFETSLWFLCVLLIIVHILVNFLMNVLFKTYQLNQSLNNWKYNRRVKAAQNNFYQGLLDYELGDWAKALKKFKIAVEYIERPITAYIFAARAAQKLDDSELANEMLHSAMQAEPSSSIAVGLIRVELLLADNKKDDAKRVLNELKDASPKNPQILILLESMS